MGYQSQRSDSILADFAVHTLKKVLSSEASFTAMSICMDGCVTGPCWLIEPSCSLQMLAKGPCKKPEGAPQGFNHLNPLPGATLANNRQVNDPMAQACQTLASRDCH